MENLYLAISKRLSQKLPDISYMDEDLGQLMATEDGYPVTFPAVLIDVGEIDWETTTSNTQRGSGAITVKLALDCYEDTHYSAGTTTRLMERIRMQKRLCKALHLFCPGENYSQLLRIKSRFYSLPGMIKVYELIFKIKTEEHLSLIE